MIYVWAAPRAAASDSLAQELRCSPIMIYMHASPLPQLFLPPSRVPPRGPICRVAAALALTCLAAAGCCRHKSKHEANPRAHSSPSPMPSLQPLLRKDGAPQHCPSNPPAPLVPRLSWQSIQLQLQMSTGTVRFSATCRRCLFILGHPFCQACPG